MRAFSLVCSLVLVSAGATAFAIGGGGTDPNAEPPPPVNTEFAGVLLRIGLGADTLAAAGITAEQVPGLVAAVEQAYSPSTLAARDEAFIAAKQSRDRLRRLVQSGKGTAEDVSALGTAETTLASASSAREGYLSGLRAAGLAAVSSNAATLVGRINANQSWHQPVQYLVKDRAQEDWVRLRDLIAARRIADTYPEAEFPAESQTALAALDAESEVATAKVNLDTRIAAIQTAWNTAAGH